MTRLRLVIEKQTGHLIGLAVLIAGLCAASRIPGFLEGSFLGLSTGTWLVLSVANAIVHQIFVWLCWRLQLHGRTLTRAFGKAAFPLYAVVFVILIAARPILVAFLAISNSGSLPADPILSKVIASLLVAPLIYLLYSIARYFGFARAFGLDHFDPGAPSWSIVRKGIFRWSRNSMYIFGFIALYVPAIYFRSIAALAASLFSHIYIWVHYFCTEKPDMAHIYGKK